MLQNKNKTSSDHHSKTRNYMHNAAYTVSAFTFNYFRWFLVSNLRPSFPHLPVSCWAFPEFSPWRPGGWAPRIWQDQTKIATIQTIHVLQKQKHIMPTENHPTCVFCVSCHWSIQLICYMLIYMSKKTLVRLIAHCQSWENNLRHANAKPCGRSPNILGPSQKEI